MKQSDRVKDCIKRMERGELTSFTCDCGVTCVEPSTKHKSAQTIDRELLESLAKVECALCGAKVEFRHILDDIKRGNKWFLVWNTGKSICAYCSHNLGLDQ